MLPFTIPDKLPLLQEFDRKKNVPLTFIFYMQQWWRGPKLQEMCIIIVHGLTAKRTLEAISSSNTNCWQIATAAKENC